jgi:MFS family permease
MERVGFIMNRNFWLLWLGKLISQMGDKFYAIALSWWILQQTDSTISMGFFLVACTIPGIILGFFAGALTDRLDRRRLMIVTDFLRGSFVFAITFLSYFDVLKVWQVFAIGIMLSSISAFFEPASQAILPELVKSEALKKANSLCQLVNGTCQVLGPLLGALVISFFGTTIVFLANGLSFYIAAVLSLFIQYKKDRTDFGEGATTILADVMEGIAFVKGKGNMITILFIIGIAHFFVGSLSVSLPFLADSLGGKGVNNLGLLETLLGAGLLAGATLCSLRSKKMVTERRLFSLMMGLGLCFLCIGTACYYEIENRVIYMIILFLAGAIIANASIFWQLLLQLNTPAIMRGRVFGISTLIGNTSLPISFGAVGILLGISSISIVMLGSGACLVILGIGLVLFQENKSRATEKMINE